MGSLIITLKTITRAGIYTRSQEPDPRAGIQPSPSTGTPGGAAAGIAPRALAPPQQLPAAKGSSGCRVHLNPRPHCHVISGILSQQGLQCEVCEELITGTT